MAKTVNGAFDEFLRETVNLDKDETITSRNSRDWLLGQIATLGEDSDFPKLWQEFNVHYGSFSRKTKIRPLDDIDLMIGLHAQGNHYTEYSDKIEIMIIPQTNLKSFCNEFTNTLNSIKIINKFVKSLSAIPQYSNADIKRNQEAATLNLKSFDWKFDIVPCFFTSPDFMNRTYYLIPDGKGNWKKTDPRIDKERAQTTNQNHNGHLLDVIRIIKYWNKRLTMPSISSYLLETIILNYYESRFERASEYVDVEFPKILQHIETSIFHQVNDHKGIQGDINNLPWDERTKISNRAKGDKFKAIEAQGFESNNDHEKSINKWREIFGNEFPKYE